jgi:hypothetical protein
VAHVVQPCGEMQPRLDCQSLECGGERVRIYEGPIRLRNHARAAENWREGVVAGFERVTTYVTPELACIIEVERYQAKIGGGSEMVPVALRNEHPSPRRRNMEAHAPSRGHDHDRPTGGVGGWEIGLTLRRRVHSTQGP